MTLSQGKAVFLWGTVISTVIFLVLTYDSLVRMPQRTHDEKLGAQAVSGKWIWQRHNCNDCHTILGIGGYYAPDVTKVMSYRDSAWVGRFIADPEAVWPAGRKMPNLRLTQQEIADVIAFLTWVNGIDTNNWPPKPLVLSAATAPNPGERLLRTNGCQACHRIGGIGGSVGPDLTQVGTRRDAAWIEAQLKNPKSHDPNSTMPSFAQLPKQDIDDLVAYLAGLR
jgi:nitric oxide reductase subunit C